MHNIVHKKWAKPLTLDDLGHLLLVKRAYDRIRGCSPTLCVLSFKNNTWNLKLGGSFDNTLCTNPKENSTK